MMLIKAVYEDRRRPCFVNMDYVIDVFPHGDDFIAYTFDNERGGYIIKKRDFDEWMKGENDG